MEITREAEMFSPHAVLSRDSNIQFCGGRFGRWRTVPSLSWQINFFPVPDSKALEATRSDESGRRSRYGYDFGRQA